MAAKGEVDLIIRAKNEATKNLDAINKALGSLADQQKIVGDSAATTDDKIAQLSLELQKLRTNAQNLKSLETVGQVLEKATDAMLRQRAAADQASTELTKVQERQQALAAQGKELGAALDTANKELDKHTNVAKRTGSTLAELGRDSAKLVQEEKGLATQLARMPELITKQQQALEQATAKQAKMAAEIASSEKVTKRQQQSLDAANRALERRRATLDASVAKEAKLRTELERVRGSMADVTATALNLNAALARQNAEVDRAKNVVTGLKVQADSVAKAERGIVRDVNAATASFEKQASALNEAEQEYAQVRAVAEKARASVAGTAKATAESGTSAAKAAVQVAALAAKLAVLAGAGKGRTSNPLNIDLAQVKAAEGAIAQMGATIRAADNETTKAGVSAKELTTALKGVGAAKNDIQQISGAISTQQNAVSGAKAAWKSAEAEVRRLAVAIKAADAPSEELAAAFGRAQGAAKLAKNEFLQQGSAAKKMAADLQQAGVGAGTLESAQAGLAPLLQRANALMNQGQTAARGLGAAVRQTGSDASAAHPPVNRLAVAINTLGAGARRMGSAVNPLRAFKNELVAMIAASAGLYAIKEQLESIWQAGADLAANQSKFATAFGSIEEGSQELAYAREVALNLKLPLATLTKNYADLALAAKGSALEGEGARKIFEAFAQTARVNQSSAADLDGVFRALTQIMSKGKVQAEELRQQLGDRLPGALQLMAQGLGITTAELDKMMEQGQLTSEALLNMAAQASSRVAPQLSNALDSPAAKLQNFQNRVLLLKEQIASSGFLDAMADAFERMADALSTPEAAEGARKIGEALADLITWLVGAIDHIDEIIAVLKMLGAAWVTLQIGSMVSGFLSMASAIGKAAQFMGIARVAATPLLAGLGLLGGAVLAVIAAFAAWKLAEWAYDNFPVFAEGVLNVKNAALLAWDGILQFWEMTAVKLKSSFTRVTAQLADIWYGMLNKILSAFPDLTSMLGLGDYAGEIAKRAAEAAAQVEKNEANLNRELDNIRSRYADKERERQKELQDDIANYYAERVAREKAENEEKPSGTRTPPPSSGSRVGLNQVTADGFDVRAAQAAAQAEKDAKAAAKKRLALERSVNDQMYAIRAQLEKKSAETLDEQLAAVPAKYAKLYDQLRQLGKDQNSEEWKTVDALVAQEQANLRTAAAKKAAAAAAKSEREEEQRRKDMMEQVNVIMQTRKNIIEAIKQAEARGDVNAVATLKENLASITVQAQEAIDKMIAFWQSVGGTDANLAIEKLKTMQLELTKVQSTAILSAENIAKAFGGQLSNAVDSFVDKFAETGNLFESAKEAFRQFAIDFLKQIAKMILQQLLFNALAGLAGGPFGSFFGTAANSISGVATNHSGGVVGRNSGPRRTVPASLFANAVRYHGGGVAGLKSNEIPTILEAGETVRTEQQEKALADRQAMAEAGAAGSTQLKIINQIDSGEMIADGLGSAAGEKAFINSIGRNRDQIKRLLA